MTGISFIMCCHNSEETVEEPLRAVMSQRTARPFELVLVNNNCTDRTVEIALDIANHASFKHLRVIDEYEPGLASARRRGVYEAVYEYLVFVDDDNIIGNSWADRVFGIFDSNTDVGIIGSNNSPCFPAGVEKPDWFDMVKGAYACNAQGSQSGDVTRNRKFVYGAGMCVRKRLLLEVYESGARLYLTGRRGSVLLSGDDSEICMRAIFNGWRLWYCHELELDHIMKADRLSWPYFTRMQQGHFASHIILDMYMFLIDKKPAPRRLDAAVEILKDWRRLLLKHKFKDMFTCGAWSSVVFAQRLGKTRGFFHYFFRYGDIRNTIVRLSEKGSMP